MGKLAFDVFGNLYDEDEKAFGDEDRFLYHFQTGHHYERSVLDAWLAAQGRTYGPNEIEVDRGRHKTGVGKDHLCEFYYYGGHRHINIVTAPVLMTTVEGWGTAASTINISGGPAPADQSVIIEIHNDSGSPAWYIFAPVDKGDTAADVVRKLVADINRRTDRHMTTTVTINSATDETITLKPEDGFSIQILVHNVVAGHVPRPPDPVAVAGKGPDGMISGDRTKLGGLEFRATIGGGDNGVVDGTQAFFVISDHGHPGATTTAPINGHVSIQTKAMAAPATVNFTAPAGTNAATLLNIVVTACQTLIAGDPALATYVMDLSSSPFVSVANNGDGSLNMSYFYISWI